jgi:hypothetical protein
MIDEKTHMWYILSGRYGDLAWEMLEDMKGKKFSYKKANKHLAFIINNWPDEEVCSTVRTWLIHSDLDTKKLNVILSVEFRDKYSEYVAEKQHFDSWPKPSKI